MSVPSNLRNPEVTALVDDELQSRVSLPGDVTYVSARFVADDLGENVTPKMVSNAFRVLQEESDTITVERWSGASNTPSKWEVRRDAE